MITDNGKELISKFLLGQVPAYATHISIGCGAIPLDNNDTAPSSITLAEKQVLDFEMSRVPIISKGFIDENGTTKISLTAELPTENRYDITEVGVWSAGRNSLAKNFDSVNIFTFTEDWQGHDTSIYNVPSPTSIGSAGNITTTSKVLKPSNNDIVFANNSRKIRKEGPRFLNSSILMRGDSSIIHNGSASGRADTFYYSVSNKSLTNNVATITTSANHNLIIGDKVYIDIGDVVFDGKHIITAVTSNTLSYAKNNVNVGSVSETGLVVPLGNWSGSDAVYTVTNKSLTSNVATITVSKTHNLKIGDTVTVNITDAVFDGTHVISARTNTTISYNKTNSDVTSVSALGTITYGNSTHIHLNAINLNIGQNSPGDRLKLAFSLIDKDAVGIGLPDYVKILIEFYRNEIATGTGFAKIEVYVPGIDFDTNRYKVIDIPISELITSSDFSASDIRVCRVFANVIHTESGNTKPSSDHYVLLDGMRLDNITTQNPLYKLIGYSVVRTSDGKPITKFTNTSNYIDFRFNIGVG